MDVVIMEPVRLALPPLNSAAAPEAVMVMPVPEAVALVFITKVVLFVTEETLAFVAKPVPERDMPMIKPAVLSQVTVALALVVMALVRVAPAAVRLSPAPEPVAG